MHPVWLLVLAWLALAPGPALAAAGPHAPSLTNNPSLDVVVTNRRPVLSFFNAAGGQGPRTYRMQLSPQPGFAGAGVIDIAGVTEGPGRVTAFRLPPGKELTDHRRWHWRVRAIDAAGRKGPWAATRFFVDTTSDDTFMGLVRVRPARVAVSSGFNAKNIVDLDDPGQASFWQSAPYSGEPQWVALDLGRKTRITRIWMLSNIAGRVGWLKDFVWQASDDGKSWRDVPGAGRDGDVTFRDILDFPPVSARYWRLLIRSWQGYAAQLNAVCLYRPGEPPAPKPPRAPYVLVVGDEVNGYTFTQIARRVRSLGLGLGALVVPHYQVSLKMVRGLRPAPVAVILSGNNASYQNLPMFEYNGVFELVRGCKLPILGICAGHQMTVFAYGLTFARSMGWSDITTLEPPARRQRIRQLAADPIFAGVPEPFTAAEVHGWAVYTLPPNYRALARSSYLQSLRRRDGLLYGVQFHPEIDAPYNQAQPVLRNFLKMALKRAK